MNLYILKFQDKPLIKIGISIDPVSRASSLGVSNFDLTESYLIAAKDKTIIRALERQLLSDYDELEDQQAQLNSGNTEIRKEVYLTSMLEDINYKIDKFPSKKITIIKGIDFKENKKLILNEVDKNKIKNSPLINEYIKKAKVRNTCKSVYKKSLFNSYGIRELIFVLSKYNFSVTFANDSLTIKIPVKHNPEYYYDNILRRLPFGITIHRLNRENYNSYNNYAIAWISFGEVKESDRYFYIKYYRPLRSSGDQERDKCVNRYIQRVLKIIKKNLRNKSYSYNSEKVNNPIDISKIQPDYYKILNAIYLKLNHNHTAIFTGLYYVQALAKELNINTNFTRSALYKLEEHKLIHKEGKQSYSIDENIYNQLKTIK